jgi:hypothetical protein
MPDLLVFLAANVANLLMVAIFVVRTRGAVKVERALGILVMAMALPVGAAAVWNALAGRPWWAVVLLLPFLLHCLLELLLDYILRLDFRHTWLLGPYLGVFYLAQWGLIGYTFVAGEIWGFVMLATYFMCLGATWYSYARVGHGPAAIQ